MIIQSTRCPECGANVDVKDSLSTFKCEHCGCLLTIDGQSQSLIKAKVRVKEMEHETERTKMRLADEKDKRDSEQATKIKTLKLGLRFYLILMGILIVLLAGVTISQSFHTNKMDKMVTEIQQDIADGRYDEAEVKIESLGSDYDISDMYKWWKIRRTLRKQLKEAKKADSKK